MSDATIASINSPEHGAQQECKRIFFSPFGKVSFSRCVSVVIGHILGYRTVFVKIAGRLIYFLLFKADGIDSMISLAIRPSLVFLEAALSPALP